MLLQVGRQLQYGKNQLVKLLGERLARYVFVEDLRQVRQFVDQVAVVVGKMLRHGS